MIFSTKGVCVTLLLATINHNNAFQHFTNLLSLNVSECNQTTVTDDAFRPLVKLQYLCADVVDKRLLLICFGN